MVVLIKILGIIFIALGVLYLSRPDFIKRMMQFFRQGYRIYFAALVRLVLAVIFLLAAGQCHHPRIVAALGIIFLLSALLIVALGADKIRAMLDWYLRQSFLILRLLALIVIAVGAVILYAA